MGLSVDTIIKATGGRLLQGEGREIKAVSIDTRTICEAEIFFALRGPVFDGHGFVEIAAQKGAVGAVVEAAEGFNVSAGFSVIVVQDTLKALGDLAGHIRRSYPVRVVAISGTCGKTTTKDMTARILSERGVLKTEGNKNNLVGLPLTLAGLSDSHTAAVLELGISRPGEMKRLSDICAPDVALITNIGRGHLEGMGDIEGVAGEKGELFGALGPDGTAIVNLDDPRVRGMARKNAGNRKWIAYSMTETADVRVKDFAMDGFIVKDVILDIRGRELEIRLDAAGEFNLMNAAGAAAAGLSFDVSDDEIKRGLEGFTPQKGRMCAHRLAGVVLLDDTYNANPCSFDAALKTLSRAGGRKIAVIGGMFELGKHTEAALFEAGKRAGLLGVDVIVSVGDMSSVLAAGALTVGLKSAYPFEDKSSAAEFLKTIIKEGDTILVKGSRAAGMETIIEGLKNVLVN
ncbi:MAG: UDP-N-acetylmuramoyl-tripeptide--D-alanyl-D-alanine ligase [Deltaproteobacteria bacterium]|nr:UDP-N-acetylmuramoyl-tripeptide--D-alanyl-D-alanine ligase [Deltaproteobacteria bacterium]